MVYELLVYTHSVIFTFVSSVFFFFKKTTFQKSKKILGFNIFFKARKYFEWLKTLFFSFHLLLLNFLLDAIVYKTMQTRSFISWKKQ